MSQAGMSQPTQWLSATWPCPGQCHADGRCHHSATASHLATASDQRLPVSDCHWHLYCSVLLLALLVAQCAQAGTRRVVLLARLAGCHWKG